MIESNSLLVQSWPRHVDGGDIPGLLVGVRAVSGRCGSWAVCVRLPL